MIPNFTTNLSFIQGEYLVVPWSLWGSKLRLDPVFLKSGYVRSVVPHAWEEDPENQVASEAFYIAI